MKKFKRFCHNFFNLEAREINKDKLKFKKIHKSKKY